MVFSVFRCSSENRERGGELIFVCDTAIDLANALDLIARSLIARRQMLDDDEVAAPGWAYVPLIGKCDELTARIKMR
jgi:hypothetical protein